MEGSCLGVKGIVEIRRSGAFIHATGAFYVRVCAQSSYCLCLPLLAKHFGLICLLFHYLYLFDTKGFLHHVIQYYVIKSTDITRILFLFLFFF